MSKTDRRDFLKLMGMTAITSTLATNISKALAIQANNRTGTIQDVEHVVVLMQENRPFDHHFGTLRGVRGFSDPRAVNIHLPLKSGTGTTPASVFMQPAGPTFAAFGVPPNTVGGPVGGVDVIPPFRVNPESVSPGLTSVGLTYLPGTSHSWSAIHAAWNQGQYDNWPAHQGPISMNYMTRQDIPYHCALADAFTVGDAYFFFETFPEVLQAAGVSWKFYQDLAGTPFAPDFGDPGIDAFVGNFGDCTVRYSNQYFTAPTSSPLFQNAVTGTEVSNIIPIAGAPPAVWRAWAEHLFDQFRSDVASGKLPQVSWIVAPAGYTEHSDWPVDYGAWYISQILDILVSNPEVFSKTVLIINYDEADGSFDHIVPPTPPQTAAQGASTVSIENEIVTAVGEPVGFQPGPIGLGTRVPFLAISPWSKGGFVNSQVFDHTSVIQFIEKRFGVHEPNVS